MNISNGVKIALVFILYTGFNMKSQHLEGEIIYTQITEQPKVKRAVGRFFFNSSNSLYTIESEKENTSIQHSQGSIIYPSNTIDSIANKTRFIFFNKSLDLFYNNAINSDTETILKAQKKNMIWKIFHEYKDIINHRCQKAETIFYGKKYIAWFTKDIPLNYGPLKINGLPGLILEVNTEDGKLKVNAEKIIFKNVSEIINRYSNKYDFTKAIPSENYKDVLRQQQINLENKINATLKEGENPIKFGDIDCKNCNKNSN